MAAEPEDSVQMRAIEWHIRLRDSDDAMWDAFANWLAEDPRHGEAYDVVEQVDLAIDPLLGRVTFREAANDAEAPDEPAGGSSRRWFLAGGALAASIAAAVALAPQLTSSRYEVSTAPGERRTVALDPGTQIRLNGSTRMTLDRKDPRFAALAEGEALFRVRHDSSNPFRLELGDDRVEDAGTVFNVVRQPGEVRVAVSEGQIIYNPERHAVALKAGEGLEVQAGSKRIRVTPVHVNEVGAWAQNRLVYSGAPMSRVAADLARALGTRILVVTALADRPFSGTIALKGTEPGQRKRLELALDVKLEAGADGWTMKPVDGAKR